jgi:hypothetical protein
MYISYLNYLKYNQLDPKTDLFNDGFEYLLTQEYNFYKVVPTAHFIVFLSEKLMGDGGYYRFPFRARIHRGRIGRSR